MFIVVPPVGGVESRVRRGPAMRGQALREANAPPPARAGTARAAVRQVETVRKGAERCGIRRAPLTHACCVAMRADERRGAMRVGRFACEANGIC